MKATSGVTGPQRFVLRLLLLEPDVGPSEIARILHFHKSTITVIMRSLEKSKLVRRTTNATDRRAVDLTLTPKGRRVAEQRTGTVESTLRKTFSKLPAREVEVARRVLEAIASELV